MTDARSIARHTMTRKWRACVLACAIGSMGAGWAGYATAEVARLDRPFKLDAATFAHAEPLPLAGAAYRVAQQAYAAYDRHDYPKAITFAREAIRQRPDVPALRVLLANALAARRQYAQASRSLGAAIHVLGPRRTLVARRAQIDALAQSVAQVARDRRAAAADGDALTGDAFTAAQNAYRAYADKRFADTVRYSEQAIALRPDVLRLRLLLVDAASAAGQDTRAWQADLDAVARFGDSEPLRLRRVFIGNGLAPQAARAGLSAREAGDLPGAVAHLHDAIAYAPDNIDYRVALFDALLASNDLAGVEAAAGEAIAYDSTEIMPFVFQAYAQAAQGRFDAADAALDRALHDDDATREDLRIAAAIAADIWIEEGRGERVKRALGSLASLGDDTTDALITQRLYSAQARMRAITASQASAPGASPDDGRSREQHIGQHARPIVDCITDEFGASCEVSPADAGFASARAAARAAERGNKEAAVRLAREAVALAPDQAQHRVELINVLDNAGASSEAQDEARAVVRDGLLAALPPMQAAYIAQQAGASDVALREFKRADASGKLTAGVLADAGFAATAAHSDADAVRYFERALDASSASTRRTDASLTPQQLDDIRGAHSEATRKWGFEASLDYRGAGMQPGFGSTPSPGIANNWQAGLEAYWRPFGSLGERMFELYARGYESFGVKDSGASGANSIEAALGARAKPFAKLDAIVAFEHIFALGSRAQSDWLARLAYSGGIGTERRTDVPAWWTTEVYAETGHYLQRGSTYATANVKAGRTYRMDRVSPRWTVFPYAVAGADYDSSINGSVPVGAGIGVSTRYAFRDSPYDTLRSYVDLSLQYRLKVAGDDRARGVFFDAVFSY
ncbi:NfrA family protein [Trinickia fusca]|uniref:Bacteriophage N4 adsorption protein A n=1 Tax=Trinickia fusca TaxID=2419777 RepID=A0A494X905_9BURK|nr:bacteriophage N4 adsorption protein A [Trinickia fusca]RKP44123.1 bacteriophage N4 adsorption protein A [Trinickia fusca]